MGKKTMVAHVIFPSIKSISSFVGTNIVYMVLNLEPLCGLASSSRPPFKFVPLSGSLS